MKEFDFHYTIGKIPKIGLLRVISNPEICMIHEIMGRSKSSELIFDIFRFFSYSYPSPPWGVIKIDFPKYKWAKFNYNWTFSYYVSILHWNWILTVFEVIRIMWNHLTTSHPPSCGASMTKVNSQRGNDHLNWYFWWSKYIFLNFFLGIPLWSCTKEGIKKKRKKKNKNAF